jgi:hypothetical protein
VAAVTWDGSSIYFLVASKRGDSVRVDRRGTIPRHEGDDPLATLAENFRADAIDTKPLVLLLPRADLEMSTFRVPAVSDDELPSVVQLELDGKVGESDRELVADFFIPEAVGGDGGEAVDGDPADETGEAGPGRRVIAYWMFEETRARWVTQAESVGMQVEAITARQLGPLGLIRSRELVADALTVAVVIYNGEIEFVFFQGHEILFLRSIRIGTTDVDALAEQVQAEIRRTTSMTAVSVGADSPDVLLLVCGDAFTGGDGADAERLADRLSARVVGSERGGKTGAVDLVLLGAASDYLIGKLAVDVLAPKKSPVPPNPVYRWATIGAVATVAALAGGYFLLADVQQLRDDLAFEKAELEKAQQVAAKFQEKADETRVVQQWLGNQVDWLDQLKLLSERFPQGQDAHLRRLRAVAGEMAGGGIDLSVEVKSPELVATLENRLRDAGFTVSSQQVSEQGAGAEYPWQFEARLAFAGEPLEEREEVQVFTPAGGAEVKR